MSGIWRWCPCGSLLANPTGISDVKPCTCTAPQIRRYLSRISGPLLDRIDIHIEAPRLSIEELMGKRTGESRATVRRRVQNARAQQTLRMKGSSASCNARMKAKELREYCEMDGATKDLLKTAIAQFGLVDVVTTGFSKSRARLRIWKRRRISRCTMWPRRSIIAPLTGSCSGRKKVKRERRLTATP